MNFERDIHVRTCRSSSANGEAAYGDEINGKALEERITGRRWTRRSMTVEHDVVDLLQEKLAILHLDRLFNSYIKCTTHLYTTNLFGKNYIQPISFQLLVMY